MSGSKFSEPSICENSYSAVYHSTVIYIVTLLSDVRLILLGFVRPHISVAVEVDQVIWIVRNPDSGFPSENREKLSHLCSIRESRNEYQTYLGMLQRGGQFFMSLIHQLLTKLLLLLRRFLKHIHDCLELC